MLNKGTCHKYKTTGFLMANSCNYPITLACNAYKELHLQSTLHSLCPVYALHAYNVRNNEFGKLLSVIGL